MGKIKIIYDKDACVGARHCEVISPALWHVQKGVAELKGATLNPKTGSFELIVDDGMLDSQMRIANACPGGAIKIVKL